MHTLRYSCFLVCALLIQSCAIRSPEAHSTLEEGFYTLQKSPRSSQTVYIGKKADSLMVYAFERKSGEPNKHAPLLILPAEKAGDDGQRNKFREHTYDMDIITIPVKYRFPAHGFPNQLNSNVNAALYAGLRTDFYKLGYAKNPLAVYKRKVAHFGYSYGVFAGLGSVYITPSVTQQLTDDEYDGFAAMAGLSGNIAVNSFTLGMALGFDHLMDKNRSIWIYRGKPWLGLTVGLNLN